MMAEEGDERRTTLLSLYILHGSHSTEVTTPFWLTDLGNSISLFYLSRNWPFHLINSIPSIQREGNVQNRSLLSTLQGPHSTKDFTLLSLDLSTGPKSSYERLTDTEQWDQRLDIKDRIQTIYPSMWDLLKGKINISHLYITEISVLSTWSSTKIQSKSILSLSSETHWIQFPSSIFHQI